MVETNNKPHWWTTLVAALDRRREIEDMSIEERERLASEIGVSGADLETIVTNGEGATKLMADMMRAKGVDPDTLAASFPAVLRSIEVTCSMCAEHGRCAHELAAGTAAEHADEFCPNATLFAEFAQAAAQK